MPLRRRNGPPERNSSSEGVSVDGQDPGEDVRFVLEQTGEWIRAADAKTGLLGAALAVLVAAIAAKFDRAHIAHWSDFPGDAIKGAILVATMLALIKAAYHMKGVLLPRTQSGDEDTRFSWPWVEKSTTEDLVRLSAATARREAWTQAKTLASIAKAKHEQFTYALKWSSITTALFFGWVVSLAWFE
ncbi:MULTISPECIES: hypothetical protein [Streptomyces]|uniref:hypothetical protein n=1 Tax=Streptomyces TaxID=1883 RepID=UPI0022E99F6E|nr:hypothetical protein [Streptomyces rochei]MCC8453392.1 hypothetical protein [Streptomyces rochei]